MTTDLKIVLDRYIGFFFAFWLNFAARFLGLVMRREHSLKIGGDILVIKMLGGGSLVMALPALLGLRQKYPDARIKLFTTGSIKLFAETLGIFDDIIALDDTSFMKMLISGMHCWKACLGCDTVLDLEVYSYLSSVFSLLTFARNRLGFFFDEKGFRQRLHTHRIFFNAASPVYMHYDRMAALLGASVATTAECTAHIRDSLGIVHDPAQNRQRLIVVGCGCSDLSPERKLAPEQWSRHVFAESPDKSSRVVFLGSHQDKDEAQKVIEAVKLDKVWPGILDNLCGTMPLAQSVRLLASCDEFWGIDSSLLHYARLLGVKTRAYLGPTHPMRLRPMDGLDEKIIYRKTACSPCIHLVSKPPCHGNNVCMKWLFDPIADDKDLHKNWLPTIVDTTRTELDAL